MPVLRFFRVPKHQHYDYKPRYWDPKKEELEDRLKQIEERSGSDPQAIKARLSGGGFRRGYQADGRYRQRQVLRSNMILLGIVVVLIIFSYLFLSVYLPRIVNILETGAQ